MGKELEFTKKMALVCKLFREEMLTDKEFEKVKRKIVESYPGIMGECSISKITA